MNDPLVSVYVTSYNHEKYIEESILSVVNQSYKNIQLIVIDDGSTDGSREILENLRQKYNFFLEFQPNQGVPKTMNKIIGYAKGKYLTGVASDDVWVEGRLEKQVKFMESHPEVAVVVGKVRYIDENSNILENFTIFTPILQPESDLSFESLIENNCIPAGATMMRRSVVEKQGGYNENTPIEDWDMWLKIAYNEKIAYMDEYLCYYRRHEANVSNNILKMYVEAWKVVNSWKDKMTPQLARKVLSRRDSLTFCVLARNHKKESLRYLHFPVTYVDEFMVKNFIKGFIKLLFCR